MVVGNLCKIKLTPSKFVMTCDRAPKNVRNDLIKIRFKTSIKNQFEEKPVLTQNSANIRTIITLKNENNENLERFQFKMPNYPTQIGNKSNKTAWCIRWA